MKKIGEKIGRIFSNDTGKQIVERPEAFPVPSTTNVGTVTGAGLTLWSVKRKARRAELAVDIVRTLTELSTEWEALKRAETRRDLLPEILGDLEREILGDISANEHLIKARMDNAKTAALEAKLRKLQARDELKKAKVDLGKVPLSEDEREKEDLKRIEKKTDFEFRKAQVLRDLGKQLDKKRDEELRAYIETVKMNEDRELVFTDMENWPDQDFKEAQEIVDYYHTQKMKHIAQAK